MTGREDAPRKAVVIYAGGDDLFVAGAWSELVELAFDIRHAFKRYTSLNPYVDISGGVGVFRPKYPLYRMAQETGELEDVAKRPRKDGGEKGALCLFREDLVFGWHDAWEGCVGTMRLLVDLCEFREGGLQFKVPRSYIHRVLTIYGDLDRLSAFWHPQIFYVTKRTGSSLRDEADKEKWVELCRRVMDNARRDQTVASFVWFDLLLRGGEQ